MNAKIKKVAAVSKPFTLTQAQSTLVADIKDLIKRRVTMTGKASAMFVEIKTKLEKLHGIAPNLTNFQLGTVIGQSEKWVKRVLSAKSEPEKAFTRLAGQCRSARASMEGQTVNPGILSQIRGELEATLAVVVAMLSTPQAKAA